jgi:hypothetical protein
MKVTIIALKNRYMVVVEETTMYVTERTSDAVCQVIGSSDVTIDFELLDSIKDIFGTEHLDSAKAIMLARVTAYDQSEAVNSFRIGNMTYWLDKATRAGLLLRLQAEQAVGKTTTTLWAGTIPITLPMNVAMQFLFALENYASECYDRTAQSIAEIGAMDNVEDILAYDYESGYPERLVLEM